MEVRRTLDVSDSGAHPTNEDHEVEGEDRTSNIELHILYLVHCCESSMLQRLRRRRTQSSEDPHSMSFPQWNNLTEELHVAILSFVAQGPYEDPKEQRSGTLTHVLPYVSSTFRRYAKSEVLWTTVLDRVLQHPVWNDAKETLTTERNPDAPSHSLYRIILQQGICFQAPVFICQCHLEDGYLEFRLFEPRYVYMMHQLVPDFTHWDGRVLDDENNEACFLLAYQSVTDTQRDALLVKVHQCQRGFIGDVFVRLQKKAFVSIDHLWVEPDTHNLYYASARKYQLIEEELPDEPDM